MQDMSSTASTRNLWIGAAITCVAAGLFPRLNAVLYEDVPIWELDPEARVLLPVVIAFPLTLFAILGRWAWLQSGGSRLAKVALVCGVLAIVGFLAFWLSLPIAFGGLALTLGLEGRTRAAAQERSGRAAVAIALGAIAAVGGAVAWLVPS